jgi:hypothetical protein
LEVLEVCKALNFRRTVIDGQLGMGGQPTAGAEARAHFQWLNGTSKPRALPKTLRIGVFPQQVNSCPSQTLREAEFVRSL